MKLSVPKFLTFDKNLIEWMAIGLLAWPLAFGLLSRLFFYNGNLGDLVGSIIAVGLAIWVQKKWPLEKSNRLKRLYLILCATIFTTIFIGYSIYGNLYPVRTNNIVLSSIICFLA